MKKKVFQILILLLILLVSLSIGCFAADSDIVDSGICGAQGDNLTWTLTNDGTLTIDGIGDMADYSYSNDYDYNTTPWISYDHTVKNIVISASVTSIGTEAFGGFSNLTSISIPDSIVTIGDRAFAYNNGITHITIPSSVSSIGTAAFSGEQLVSIQVSKSNTNYASDDHGVLFNKSYTSLIQCPRGKTGAYTIPSSVISVEKYAFTGYNLSSVVIPESVAFIGDEAFRGIYKSPLIIPASVSSIGRHAFNSLGIPAIIFQGNAPLGTEIFTPLPDSGIYNVVKAYYHADNPTWTKDSIYNYGGLLDGYIHTNVTWIAHTFFADVAHGTYYEIPVLWAVTNGITTGKTATTFGPEDGCTRAQVVTFLWRAAGEPEPTSSRNPFTDVKADQYYYKPVLWAVANGITTGKTATTFGPNDTCTRGQIVTFLHRAQD